ncbi:MAG: penicillin-binding protein 2 [Actinomycetota bacterium]|nr:penicillin-binding protein 2 [Actinomycetota bacterium]
MRRTRTRRGTLRGLPTLRLKVGFLVIAMLLSIFVARLVQLQGLDPQSYAQMAAAEGQVNLVLPAERGDILDRDGEPLADSVDGLMVVANPTMTADRAPELAKFLATRLKVDYFTTLERLRAEDSQFQYIARQVPASLARSVLDAAEEKEFEGLDIRDDPVRVYPARDVAANLVGFLGTPRKSGAAKPLAGFEDSFDTHLAGTDGEAKYQVGGGNRIPLGDSTVTEAVDGKDLQTTIDRDLQWYSQRVLAQAVRQYGAESGFAVVQDSRTGEILALPDYPTYDASRPLESPEELFKSSALSDVYEPGSVQKVLTLSGLIDAGKVTARTKLLIPGTLARDGRVIHDWFPHGLLKLTLAGVLAKSSNIGTVKAADEFEPGQLRRYLEAFGLGRRTGVGVGGETAGLLPSPSMWTGQTEDRIDFGQSLSVNGVQMAAAVNTIANGGVRIDPSLIKGSATMDDGTEVGTDTATRRRVVSAEAARQTALMMERVLDPEAGVAPGAAVPGYRVAGKTGTAQRVGDECGCYDGTFTVSFAGFAPADDPRFTIYVVIQDPRSGGGGSVAGPVFAKLMSFTLRHYQVPPTNTPPSRLPVEWR